MFNIQLIQPTDWWDNISEDQWDTTTESQFDDMTPGLCDCLSCLATELGNCCKCCKCKKCEFSSDFSSDFQGKCCCDEKEGTSMLDRNVLKKKLRIRLLFRPSWQHHYKSV